MNSASIESTRSEWAITTQMWRLLNVPLWMVILIGFNSDLTETTAVGQTMSFEEIRATLDSNSPVTGDQVLREEAILSLDHYLKMPNAIEDPDVIAFYNAQMQGLASDVRRSVRSGARIWQMYNHGYIVKTPSSTFSFDLVNGPSGAMDTVPKELLEQIDVAFVSHGHSDHLGQPSLTIGGGFEGIIWPATFPSNTTDTVGGLQVSSFFGLHSLPNNIFHVTTQEGIAIMHTGDTQRSSDLPSQLPTDILLINAWMNESGTQPASVGVRNGINRVAPELAIPGHIQELGHAYDPGSVTTRVPYEWAYAIDDSPIAGKLSVMAWGEAYDYNVVPEPTSAFLLCGMAVAAWLIRRR